MAAFLQKFLIVLAQTLMFSVTAPLAILAGAWLGRLIEQPKLGGFFGIANVLIGAIARYRHEPTFYDRARAWKLDTSPYVSVPIIIFCVFLVEIIGGSLGFWLGGHHTAVGNIYGAILGAGLFGLWLAYAVISKQPITAMMPRPGTARTATLAELTAAGFSLDVRQGIFVGEWRYFIPRLWYQVWRPQLVLCRQLLSYNGPNSTLLVAPPGAGKFSCAVGPTLLLNETDSFIVLDPKGQCAAVSAVFRRDLGHNVIILNPFAEHPEVLPSAESGALNPLADLEPDSMTFETDIKALASILLPVDESDRNKYFQSSAQDIAAAAMMMTRDREGLRATLPRVVELLSQPPPARNELFRAMADSHYAFVQDIGNRYWRHANAPAPPESNEGIMGDVNRNLAWLSLGANRQHPEKSVGIARLFGYGVTTPLFSWRQLKEQARATTVYLILPVDTQEGYAKLAQLLIGGAVNTLIKGKKTPLWFLVDEMPNAIGTEASALIQRAFNAGRGAGLRIQGIAQNWPQLERQFSATGTAAHGVMGLRSAAGLLQFFGANDPVTCEVIRKEAGDKNIWQSNSNPLAMAGINGGVGEMPLPYKSDQELKDMLGEGQQITFMLGSGATAVLHRRDYRKIATALKRAKPDPTETREAPRRSCVEQQQEVEHVQG